MLGTSTVLTCTPALRDRLEHAYSDTLATAYGYGFPGQDPTQFEDRNAFYLLGESLAEGLTLVNILDNIEAELGRRNMALHLTGDRAFEAMPIVGCALPPDEDLELIDEPIFPPMPLQTILGETKTADLVTAYGYGMDAHIDPFTWACTGADKVLTVALAEGVSVAEVLACIETELRGRGVDLDTLGGTLRKLPMPGHPDLDEVVEPAALVPCPAVSEDLMDDILFEAGLDVTPSWGVVQGGAGETPYIQIILMYRVPEAHMLFLGAAAKVAGPAFAGVLVKRLQVGMLNQAQTVLYVKGTRLITR